MYRKFSAGGIFTGYQVLEQHVLITDEKGTIIDLVDEHDAGEDIEKFDGLLSPGFINCHCHLELSHMKGLVPRHTGLVDFVLKVVNERHFEEAEILSAIEAAEDEMWQNGIVAVGDICNNTLTIPQKTKGRLLYHNFIEASGFPPPVAEQRFKRAVDIYDAYAKVLPAGSIVPHAPYSVSPELFRMIDAFPGNDILSIHNQEIADENEFFEKGTGDLQRLYDKMGIDISFFKASGKDSLQTFFPYLKNNRPVILVHNVCSTESDIRFINTQPQTSDLKLQTSFCLCPNANLYISNRLPDVDMLIRNNCHMVLGTDSLASNDQLCIFEEIKTLREHFPKLKLSSMLQWATINGARALNTDATLGSFEKGKKPGIVLIGGVDDGEVNKGTFVKRIL